MTEPEVLYVNYGLFVFVLAPVTFGIERKSMRGLATFSGADWTVLFS